MLASVRFANAAFRATTCLVGAPLVRKAACASPTRGLPASLWVTARGRGSSGKYKKDAMTRGVKKENLPTKVCVVCDRPFTWRKKWEQCWDEVTTCSKSCNAKRKKAKGTAGAGNDGEEDDVDGARSENEGDSHGASNADAKNDQRKANKKAVKAAKRAKRGADAVSDGEGDDTAVNDGSKPCDLCSKHVDFLIRCRVDSTKQWKMACGRCWKRASGGVPDGDAEHPHYRYGGLWKNRRANSDAGVKSGWKKGGKRLDRKGKENANKSDDEPMTTTA